MESTRLIPSGSQNEEQQRRRKKLAIQIIYMGFACVNVFGSGCFSQFVHTMVAKSEEGINASNIRPTENTNSCHSQRENVTQKHSSFIILYMNLIQNLCSLPLIILGGAYSDYWKRKKILYLPVIGYLSRYVFTLMIYLFDLDIRFLFVTSFLVGASGSANLFRVLVMASLADVTSSAHRSYTFIFTDSIVGTAISLLVLVQGFVIRYLGFNYVFYISSGGCLLVCIAIHFGFPDTFEQTERIPKFTKAFRDMFVLGRPKMLRNPASARQMICLVFALVSILISLISKGDIEKLYVLGQPFCWSVFHIAIYDCVKDIYNRGLGCLMVKVMHRFLRDEIIAMFGVASFVLCCLLLLVAKSDSYIYIGAALSVLSPAPLPCTEGMMSKMTLRNKQGALQANIYILQTLAALGGYSIFEAIYGETQKYYRGLVFLVMIVLAIPGFVFLWIIMCQKERTHTAVREDTTTEAFTGNIQQ